MGYAYTIIFFKFPSIPFILSTNGMDQTIEDTGMTDERESTTPEGGSRSTTGDQTLITFQVGALPILNRILERLRLEHHFREYLEEDPRCEVSPVKALLILVRNFICSREPIYGVGEWAARQAPDLLGLGPDDISRLNDDRVGRCLVNLFNSDYPALVLRVVAHAINEFKVKLEELHNDSTTITFHGNYEEAAQERKTMGKEVPAITQGHNKDHRPDLKQLLYNLTISADGAVPIYFSTESGNVTDDQTHRRNWDVLRTLVGHPGFFYVADCKLATTENMNYIAQNGGKFISVLPDNRKECKEFRARVAKKEVTWELIWEKKDKDNENAVVDVYSIARQPALSAEGFRVIWFHSRRKAELDAISRHKRVQRALAFMSAIQQKLLSPKSRSRQRSKIQAAVEKCLARYEAENWIKYSIRSYETETFHQARPGRPTNDTPYQRKVTIRWELEYELDQVKLAEEIVQDGIFPLVTNDKDLSELEVLQSYKRQPMIEKRFAQLKTDYEAAPVYLKSPRRIMALLCIYFFALLLQALVERELRRAMAEKGIGSLPIYPECRHCAAPTTRRVVDLFENIQRHELRVGDVEPHRFLTSLSSIQTQVVELFGLPVSSYGA
jgi:transposase